MFYLYALMLAAGLLVATMLIKEHLIAYPERVRSAKPLVLNTIKKKERRHRHLVEETIRPYLGKYRNEAPKIIDSLEAQGIIRFEESANGILILPVEQAA